MICCDAEYFDTTEENVVPVCLVTYDSLTNLTKKWWTLDCPEEIENLKKYLLQEINQDFFSYNVVAEGRYFLALGLDPVKFKWIDGFLEYRCLTNGNDKLSYGDQLVKGVVKKTKKPPPKWERTEQDSQNSFKPTHSLAEATYKLLGVIRDTEHKTAMRDILISGNRELILENKEDILEYCKEDTVFLPSIYSRIIEEYKRLLKPSGLSTLKSEMFLRGEYSALTAKMESNGYPINVEKTRNFTKSVLPLLDDCQREINELFPEISPFVFDFKEGKFKWNQKSTRQWLAKNVDVSRWKKTDGYKKAIKSLPKGVKLTDVSPYMSLSLEAFEKVFSFQHDYPKDNYGAQIVRYLKLKQNLNGFVISGDKKNFWDYVGRDGRVRPYFNIYGAQSSRSQPGSTGYLFLKPAWMRSLCEPTKGKAIAAFDYKSEEFLLSALMSKDENMIASYASSDVYLSFAKLAGAIPPNGTKEEYKKERNLFKATCLLEGSLIRVKGKGFIPIEKIISSDEVWDGGDWRKCGGSKRMPRKDTILWKGISVTKDHKIKTNKGWEEVGKYNGIPENSQNTRSRNWKEVWPLVCSLSLLIYKKIIGEILHIGRGRVRKKMRGEV